MFLTENYADQENGGTFCYKATRMNMRHTWALESEKLDLNHQSTFYYCESLGKSLHSSTLFMRILHRQHMALQIVQ